VYVDLNVWANLQGELQNGVTNRTKQINGGKAKPNGAYSQMHAGGSGGELIKYISRIGKKQK